MSAQTARYIILATSALLLSVPSVFAADTGNTIAHSSDGQVVRYMNPHDGVPAGLLPQTSTWQMSPSGKLLTVTSHTGARTYYWCAKGQSGITWQQMECCSYGACFWECQQTPNVEYKCERTSQ